MTERSATAYGAPLQRMIDSAPANDLGPGMPNESVLADVEQLSLESFEAKIADRDLANCCLSGIWLKHDFLDRSHSISQDIASSEGSYWHAIMHRREPDYSNSKYWYRRVGEHSVYRSLAERLRGENGLAETIETCNLISGDQFEPYNFVDACQTAAQSGHDSIRADLQRIAVLEWHELFDWCYRHAIAD